MWRIGPSWVLCGTSMCGCMVWSPNGSALNMWLSVRHFLFLIHPGTDLTHTLHTHTHTFLSCLIFLGHVKALIAPNEPLTPALLYVSVALLSGSILACNHSVLTRGLLPPTFFLLSFHHLPKTSQNVSAYAGAWCVGPSQVLCGTSMRGCTVWSPNGSASNMRSSVHHFIFHPSRYRPNTHTHISFLSYFLRPCQGPHRPQRTSHTGVAIHRRGIAQWLHPRVQPLHLDSWLAPPDVLLPLVPPPPPQNVAERLGVRRCARGGAPAHAGTETRGRNRARAHDVGAILCGSL